MSVNFETRCQLCGWPLWAHGEDSACVGVLARPGQRFTYIPSAHPPAHEAPASPVREVPLWTDGRGNFSNHRTVTCDQPVTEAPKSLPSFSLVISGEERALIDSALQSHDSLMHARIDGGKTESDKMERFKHYKSACEACGLLALRLKRLSPIPESPTQLVGQESQQAALLTCNIDWLIDYVVDRIKKRWEK